MSFLYMPHVLVLKRPEKGIGSSEMVFIGSLESHMSAENLTLVIRKGIRHCKLHLYFSKTLLFKYHISQGGFSVLKFESYVRISYMC